MRIIISKKLYNDESFVRYIISNLSHDLIRSITKVDTRRYNNIISQYVSKNLDLLKIIELCSQSLTYKELDNYYIVYIDNNAIEYVSKIKINTLVKLLVFGNTQIKGSNFIPVLFNTYQNNISKMWNMYKLCRR